MTKAAATGHAAFYKMHLLNTHVLFLFLTHTHTHTHTHRETHRAQGDWGMNGLDEYSHGWGYSCGSAWVGCDNITV